MAEQASTTGRDRVTEGEKKRNSRSIGRLLERGLQAALPATHFPFAVRLTVDLLSADGSETMAALSAASLALADAGVPIQAHVAGLLPPHPLLTPPPNPPLPTFSAPTLLFFKHLSGLQPLLDFALAPPA